MDDMDGRIAFKLIGHLITAIDQHSPQIIDTMYGSLAINAERDPLAAIGRDAVRAVIDARSAETA